MYRMRQIINGKCAPIRQTTPLSLRAILDRGKYRTQDVEFGAGGVKPHRTMLREGELCNIKYSMKTRLIAVTELALILPAALFMIALILRSLLPRQYKLAHTAEQLVMWYAARMWTLWVLLLALPLAALVTGCATLRHTWKWDVESTRQSLTVIRTHLATLVVVATTLTAAAILAIVVLHMLAN